MIHYLLPTLAFLAELLVFFLLVRRGLVQFGVGQVVLRVVLAMAIAGMGVVHFTERDDLARMIPPALPEPTMLVTVTGLLEFAAAAGLLVPRIAPAAALGFSFLLVAIFPANVYAAGEVVAGLRMPGVLPRTLLQMVLIALALIAGWGVPRSLRG
jgi:uncharacterized membrane protein